MIGRCAVPLEGLLRESSSIQLQDQPVISVTSDEVVARISVDVSIALPVSELYRLRLRQTE